MVFSGGVVCFPWMIYVFARSSGVWSRLFGCRPLVFLGEISFAFYMCHQLIFRFMTRQYWTGSNLGVIEFGLVCLVLTVCASTLLYRLIEIPVKDSLVRMYQSDWAGSWQSFIRPVHHFIFGWNSVSLAVLVLLMMCYVDYRRRYETRPSATAIVQTTEPRFRSREFGYDAIRLEGFRCDPCRNGCRFYFVWRKLSDKTMHRSLVISGRKGKPIRKLTDRRLLDDQTPGDVVVERVFVHKNFMNRARSVSLTIRDPKAKAKQTAGERVARAKSSVRLMNRNRIAVLSPESGPKRR